MTPEYLRELADIADPDQLWRLRPSDRCSLPADKRKQLDAGIALRRHAAHVERMWRLIGSGKSLLITQLSENGTDLREVLTPAEVRQFNFMTKPAAQAVGDGTALEQLVKAAKRARLAIAAAAISDKTFDEDWSDLDSAIEAAIAQQGKSP